MANKFTFRVCVYNIPSKVPGNKTKIPIKDITSVITTPYTSHLL